MLGLAPIVGRHHDGSPLRLGNPIHVANPGDRRWARHGFLLWFGSFCPTYVLAYADGLEDALEEAAAFCAEAGWVGIVAPEPDCGCDDPHECGCYDYTDSGWIVGHEWGIVAEDPPKSLLIELHFAGRPREREES